MTTQYVNILAVVLLYAWIPIVFVLFALMPARRAVITAFVVGYLFLPEVSFYFHTLPAVNKVSLTAVGVVLGSMVFDGGRLFAIRPRPIDLAIALLCLSPIVTSVLNDLGFMDGLANCFTMLFTWGLAYWVGRAYFRDWESTRELAMGIVLGGLAYAPLCWWEIRMSPQLHGWLYGLQFNSFRTDRNLFGWRPNVFLANGLTVTMFIGISTLLAFWAWMTRSPRRLLGLPMGWIALFLFVTAVFCKAFGGIVLMTLGITALLMTKWSKTKVAVLCLIVAAPLYILVRTTGEWSGNRLVEIAAWINPERGKSLAFRLTNENELSEKALRRPFFGFGGFSRSHVWVNGRDLTIVDGLWIIMLGEYGLVGLAALVAWVLGAAFMMWYRVPTRYWTDAACAAPVALAVAITLYMIDSLFNATFNPVASLAVGAVASMSSAAAAVFAPRVVHRPRPIAAPLASPVVSSVKDLPYAYPAYRS